jgi:membrane protein implicated in regulation of membrane protease activity
MKMDIFFFITSVTVFLLAVLAIIALVYVIKILRNVEHVSERVAEESDNIKGDIATLRSNVREQGLKMKHFAEFFGTITRRNTRKKSAQKTDNN